MNQMNRLAITIIALIIAIGAGLILNNKNSMITTAIIMLLCFFVALVYPHYPIFKEKAK